MSMKFIEAESIAAAVSTLAQYGYDAKVIAGGTAVVLMLQQKLIAPEVLVSLGRIGGLDYVTVDENGLHLGPMLTLHQVARTPAVQERFPALAHACEVVGNIRVRQQATLAGNLAEADYASDPPAVLLALDAVLTAQGLEGERQIPLSEFFLGFYTTALAPEEIISDVTVPAPAPGTRMTYHKFTTRSSEDRPAVGVAAVATVEDGICRDLRVAVGAATAVPQRLPAVEEQARGARLDAALIEEIAEQYATELEPLDDLRGSAWYRKQMIGVHVRRALTEVSNERG